MYLVMSGERRAKVSVRWCRQKEYFERRKFHRNVFLPRDGADNSSTGSKSSCIVGSSILGMRQRMKEERCENGRKMPMKLQMEKKRGEERGGSKKRKKYSKFKVSSLKSKAQPMTNHSTSYTPTQHDPTVLTFMVAFTLRPHLIVPQFY